MKHAITITDKYGVNEIISDVILRMANEQKRNCVLEQSAYVNWQAYKIDSDNYRVIGEYGTGFIIKTGSNRNPDNTAEFQTNIKTGDLIGLNDLGKQIISEADRTN